jgi:hypothetical protein
MIGRHGARKTLSQFGKLLKFAKAQVRSPSESEEKEGVGNSSIAHAGST